MTLDDPGWPWVTSELRKAFGLDAIRHKKRYVAGRPGASARSCGCRGRRGGWVRGHCHNTPPRMALSNPFAKGIGGAIERGRSSHLRTSLGVQRTARRLTRALCVTSHAVAQRRVILLKTALRTRPHRACPWGAWGNVGTAPKPLGCNMACGALGESCAHLRAAA